MSGHSHWATTKRDKAVNDSKRSKMFSKISRAIIVSAKQGGGDPETNAALRLAVEKAREARMPKDNIERAIAKGTGKAEGVQFEEVTYEGYGPNGVAFLIKGLTDNKNRTVSEVRGIFSRHGGSLGAAGSTAYIFASDLDNPTFMVEVDDVSVAKKINDLYEELDDQDDIQDIFINFKPVGECASLDTDGDTDK